MNFQLVGNDLLNFRNCCFPGNRILFLGSRRDETLGAGEGKREFPVRSQRGTCPVFPMGNFQLGILYLVIRSTLAWIEIGTSYVLRSTSKNLKAAFQTEVYDLDLGNISCVKLFLEQWKAGVSKKYNLNGLSCSYAIHLSTIKESQVSLLGVTRKHIFIYFPFGTFPERATEILDLLQQYNPEMYPFI